MYDLNQNQNSSPRRQQEVFPFVLHGRGASLQYPRQLLNITKTPIPAPLTNAKYDQEREHAYIMAQALRSYSEHTSHSDDELSASKTLRNDKLVTVNREINSISRTSNNHSAYTNIVAVGGDALLPKRVRSKSASCAASAPHRGHSVTSPGASDCPRTVQSARSHGTRTRGRLYNHNLVQRSRNDHLKKHRSTTDLTDLKVDSSNNCRVRKLNFARMRLPGELEDHSSGKPINSQSVDTFVGSRNAIFDISSPIDSQPARNARKKYNYNHPDWVTSNLSIRRLNINDKPEVQAAEPEVALTRQNRTLSFNINLPENDVEITQDIEQDSEKARLQPINGLLTAFDSTDVHGSERLTSAKRKTQYRNSTVHRRHLVAWGEQL